MEARVALALAGLLLAPVAAPATPVWALVEYAGPVPSGERAFLFAVADLVADPVPSGYLARLSPSAVAALRERPAVAAIHDAPPALASRDLTDVTREVRLLLYPDGDPAAVAERVRSLGAAWAAPAASPEPIVDAHLGRVGVATVLSWRDVRWVEPLRERGELDNDRASAIVQGGEESAWSVHERGVDGRSQLVAYCDTGLDTDAPLGLGAGRAVHEMFADVVPLAQNAPAPLHRKVALYYAPVEGTSLRGDLDDANGHGTHVAGTLAGDAGVAGARDGHDGVAYGARLVVCDAQRGPSFQVLADHRGYWQPAYDAGARVHSNSWGTSPSADYGLAARQHDAYAWSHRDLLILRSMGNTGPDGTMRPEAAAKNVLAIGASTTAATGALVPEWSGRGPTSDGRVKPDLVAPGDCVTSAELADPTGYECWSGTSHATPVVAGAATLVRDYFARGFHPDGAREASSALVRAVLIASARPLAAASPDGTEGWGRPELDGVLEFAGGSLDLRVHDETAPLETSGSWTTTVEVPPGATLRIVLAWTDHPASPGASPALVNDLDLEVLTPSGALLRGNADLGAPDRTNVVERVHVASVEGGAHTIRVRAWSVPMGPQPFALVAVVR